MTIKELEAYQIICSKGSLSKAARDLFITPQGLSRVLKNLETELDCTLVNRVASGLELTESGKCLLEYAQKAISEYEKLKETMESIRGSVHGTVDLLMAYDLIRIFDPECFAAFQRQYPGISFSCREFPDRITEQMLAEGQGNAAISIGPFSEDLFHIQLLMDCSLSLIVYEGHPLCEKKEVTIEDLKGEPLYIENSSFKINEFVQRRCWMHGFEPDIAFEASSFDICCKMARMKKGITVLPDIIYEDMKTDGLVQIPFSEGNMELEIGFLTPKSKSVEPAVSGFGNFLENSCAEKRACSV